MKYTAKVDYQSSESAQTYEDRSMYNGYLGRRRVSVETNIIKRLAERIVPGSTLLDCPCGNGRWFEILSKNVACIRGIDVSKGMVEHASKRSVREGVGLRISQGDAENLPLNDREVDYVFSYALMKHIPVHIQFSILKEFARVSERGVFCSFAVLTPLAYAFWRRRNHKESFPIIREELDNMAKHVSMRLTDVIKVSQPVVGLEYFAVFDHM